jgi:hypothetical protein
MSRSQFTRRTFIKGAAGVAAITAGGIRMSGMTAWGSSAEHKVCSRRRRMLATATSISMIPVFLRPDPPRGS